MPLKCPATGQGILVSGSFHKINQPSDKWTLGPLTMDRRDWPARRCHQNWCSRRQQAGRFGQSPRTHPRHGSRPPRIALSPPRCLVGRPEQNYTRTDVVTASSLYDDVITDTHLNDVIAKCVTVLHTRHNHKSTCDETKMNRNRPRAETGGKLKFSVVKIYRLLVL